MPRVITNPEDEELITLPTIAESWRVPTEAIQEAVDEAIGQLAPVNDATLTIKQNNVTKGTFTANDADDTTIELQDTTYTNFTGTDGTTAGQAGLVPAPATTDAGKYLKSDGTWGEGGASAVLYNTTGQNTDGAMTQKATTDALGGKQNSLTAGTNISISSDVISATDTTYSAGSGLSLDGTEFSADTTVLATQTDLSNGLATKQNTLTAGSNIQINNDTISATDTTYSDFTGTDGTTAGAAGLVPAPSTADADKFLKSDGTWAEAGGGGGTGVEIVKKEITTNILARDLFELTSADNQDYRRAYMVKNTSNDVRKIVFSNSISTDNPTEYVAIQGNAELFIVLLGKGIYQGGGFIAFEPHGARGETGVTNDPVIIGGLFGYSISNPQIRRMQIGAIDNLTTTSADDALAASQGKVLNDKIGGDLSNLTTTDKSSLINAINELNTRISNL